MKRRAMLIAGIIAIVCIACAGRESRSSVTVLVSVEDTKGRPIAIGTIGVGLVIPDGKYKYRTERLDTSGDCVLELDPNVYGIRWNTKDSLRPIRVELDGAVVDNYPVFIKEYESVTERTTSIGGRSIGAEVAVTDKQRTLLFVVSDELESHRVTGSIRDASGKGIRTRCDLYRDDRMNCSRCGDTDNTGRFDFVARKFPIRLVPRDYSGLWIFRPEEIYLAGPITDSLQFEAIPRTADRLSGVVIDHEKHQPVSMAWIEYKQECPNQSINGRVRPDHDGRFELSCIPGCGMTIDIRHIEKAYNYVSHEIPSESCEEILTIEL